MILNQTNKHQWAIVDKIGDDKYLMVNLVMDRSDDQRRNRVNQCRFFRYKKDAEKVLRMHKKDCKSYGINTRRLCIIKVKTRVYEVK